MFGQQLKLTKCSFGGLNVLALWILKPWRHIEDIMSCINLVWTKYDDTDGLDVKCTARHCMLHKRSTCKPFIQQGSGKNA